MVCGVDNARAVVVHRVGGASASRGGQVVAAPAGAGGAATTTTVTWTRWDYYYNENWQVVEERRSADLGRDLEAWYTFDESAGSTAGDSSGNGNTATLCGNATWTEGQFGNALLLDGSGDYAKVAQPAGLDFAPGSFTVSAWINPDVVTGGWRSILEYDRYNVPVPPEYVTFRLQLGNRRLKAICVCWDGGMESGTWLVEGGGRGTDSVIVLRVKDGSAAKVCSAAVGTKVRLVKTGGDVYP